MMVLSINRLLLLLSRIGSKNVLNDDAIKQIKLDIGYIFCSPCSVFYLHPKHR